MQLNNKKKKNKTKTSALFQKVYLRKERENPSCKGISNFKVAESPNFEK